MQQPQGDHLTGPEVRLRMFGDGAHLLIDLVEQCRDKIGGDHGLLRSWPGVMLSTSVEEVHDHDNKTIKYYRVSLVCQRLTPLVSILVFTPKGELVSHVGIVVRTGTPDGSAVTIGSVKTHPRAQGRGYA